MAKKKKAAAKSITRSATPANTRSAAPISKTPTNSPDQATGATVNVTFSSGTGTITATLFQYLTGAIIGHGSVTVSGDIKFPNAGKGDAISVNGNCSGKAVININRTTDPATPKTFSAGNINFGFDIL